MDVQDLLTFVKTLDGANDYTVGVLAAETGLSHNVRHRTNLLTNHENESTMVRLSKLIGKNGRKLQPDTAECGGTI
jgi:hypothetical protein